ncbi:hypothetical protein ACFC8N_42625 [Streptomyces sp. NPDC055966]|uniref:hypothetical protein n=1 Tax=Streptomyces sp. NPDC055966 TaxID=3345669 RepID=UPI0035D835AC
MTTDQPTPTARSRIVLWPEPEDADFPAGDTSLTQASDDELRFYAANYAGVPLRELMRRLRLAEWNAAEYQRQAEELQASTRQMPPLQAIREMDDRHKRIRGLLATPGRISRADLEAALREPAV